MFASFILTNSILLIRRSTDVNVTPLTSRSVTPATDKNATPSTRGLVRRLVTRRNAMMFQNKNVIRFPSRNVARFPRRTVEKFLSKFVTLSRRKNAEMFQDLTARRLLQDYVVLWPGNTALMFLTSSVTKFPRLNAMTLTLSIASRFPSKTAGRSLEDTVSWFLASEPRRWPCRNVQSPANRDVSPPPERWIDFKTFQDIIYFLFPGLSWHSQQSWDLQWCTWGAVWSPADPCHQVRGWWRMPEHNRQEMSSSHQTGVSSRGGAGAQADLRDRVQDWVYGGMFPAQLWRISATLQRRIRQLTL